jgi:hypothetical protein
MMSPRSKEIKLGAEKPLKPEEAKGCELKEERVSAPVRRSEHIQGMKRKDYKEVSPKPKDYGGSGYSDDRCPSSWATVRREDNDLNSWEEVPKEKTPEGPNGGGNPNDSGDDGDRDPGNVDLFGMHPLCCAACRHSISGLNASVDECF